jgi:hypothetical protein
MIILELIAAYYGYKRWGGWTGALLGVLIVWAVYLVIVGIAMTYLFLMRGQIETILSSVGNSV